jgi:chorismate mutase
VQYSLDLEDIRGVLNRLEETIIFALIERAQFLVNATIYRRGAFAGALGPDKSLVDYLLHGTERIHAAMRRYTAPEEEPFFDDLPAPLFPAAEPVPPLLRPNAINLTPEIRSVYEREIVPRLCGPGDDGHYGSSSVCDVHCLQAIAQRVHYAKFVAESKYAAEPGAFNDVIARGDRNALTDMITAADVERTVLERVRIKARTYGMEPGVETPAARVNAELVAGIYGDWIIPLSKEVQIRYLLARAPRSDAPPASRTSK